MRTLSDTDRAALLEMFPHLMDSQIDGGKLARDKIDAFYADYWDGNHVFEGLDQLNEEMDR